jgi:hypothetical protein
VFKSVALKRVWGRRRSLPHRRGGFWWIWFKVHQRHESLGRLIEVRVPPTVLKRWVSVMKLLDEGCILIPELFAYLVRKPDWRITYRRP